MCRSCCQPIQNAIFGNMERFFNWFGEKVAKYPFWVILASLIFVGLCGLGILNLDNVTEQEELWVPSDSDFYRNSKWVSENFPSQVRAQQFMLSSKDGGNVVTKENLKLVSSIMKGISEISVIHNNTNVTKEDLCQRIPPCNECVDVSPLFYWSEVGNCDEDKTDTNLENTADDQIFNHLNTKIPFFGQIVDPGRVIGGQEVDSDGKLTKGSALAIIYVFIISEKFTAEYHEAWETEYLEYMNNVNVPEGLRLDAIATRSFSDEIGKTIGSDAQLLSFGFMVVFNYILIMLGKFNSVEQRAYLALIGIGCIGLGIATSYGLAGLFGVPNTSMNSLLPFLLLGIGVDDMFVIVQSFNILEGEDLTKALISRFGLALRHAGVAITITSVTDLLAFGIGGTTILPALQSFCFFAAIGIFFVFAYMVTFFLAFFTLDQRRIEAHRDGCCFFKHKNWVPNRCSQTSILDKIFEAYSKVVVKLFFKIPILVITVVFLGLGAYGLSQLKAEFSFTSFLDEGTYLRDYVDISAEKFPSGGISGNIYIAEKPNIHQYIPEIQAMINETDKLKGDTLSNQGVKSFIPDFIQHVRNSDGQYPDTAKSMTKTEFDNHLLNFLKTDSGSNWITSFKFNPKFSKQMTTLPNLTSLLFPYSHYYFGSSVGNIKAMNALSDIVESHQDKIEGGVGRIFAYSNDYSNYVTIEIITSELLRNVILAIACIFLVTLLLLTDFIASGMVMLSVIITLIDVAGFMHFWGISVDTVSAILLTVAMGLAVDYSAHIAHYFMTVRDSDRNARAQETLVKIGPAVINGGFSTFLSFILLITSKSYVFQTFFKIFFLVVFFGLFHGIVFLPVLLSLIGPQAHEFDHHDNSVKPIKPETPKDAWNKPEKF